ncbi:Xaa-Pro peptidase family protein [Gammaproteobacteria bacterium]|nr:Xaa-Pro peptidase family protein [Gammaproteobacteria bacterium]
MTIGVGGSVAEQQLATLGDLSVGVPDIALAEYQNRINRVRKLMQRQDIAALYLNAGTNLYYFTGTRWTSSERMVGAVVPHQGDIHYIAPEFERGTLNDFIKIRGNISCWQEHEDPYELLQKTLVSKGITSGRVGIDESTPFFMYDGIRNANPSLGYTNAQSVTQPCRMIKSGAEIGLLQRAKDMTLTVHKATARMLRSGITTTEVTEFIDQAHRRVGAPGGSYFCIVLFGEATAYPHGVKHAQSLEDGDMVLIDTGCQLHGYISDITRSYVYGEPSPRQREVWDIEKEAQASAFTAARLGQPCSAVDLAARLTLERHGLGPGYKIPGLPHRTGHGIGLDIHEGPYLVGNDHTPLEKGMCFSNEPMICIPGEFGIRHEDHFYMTDSGPRWFTQPAHSVDDPFGVGIDNDG